MTTATPLFQHHLSSYHWNLVYVKYKFSCVDVTVWWNTSFSDQSLEELIQIKIKPWKRGKGRNGYLKPAQLRDLDSLLKDHDKKSCVGVETHGQVWEWDDKVVGA